MKKSRKTKKKLSKETAHLCAYCGRGINTIRFYGCIDSREGVGLCQDCADLYYPKETRISR